MIVHARGRVMKSVSDEINSALKKSGRATFRMKITSVKDFFVEEGKEYRFALLTVIIVGAMLCAASWFLLYAWIHNPQVWIGLSLLISAILVAVAFALVYAILEEER
jgi:Kef-type K+ transport system membrane component KefB